ncbi:uncharacterized protein CELE_F52G3.7 [Caenorhabditis elegans]|uniref:Uncharacterized protein n=1 Tax=Caenorhabditis elegans TaxID=6239 RepID=A0A2K5AU08_CAEEL|nr:Uncharacterized protein CELE_F52G3.7 [Caenorhabditis elegans]SPC48669.2 Uncharacterized protein CELE_F52G3.7 [Caenorhabditis elegans]|eukprot:NP_001348808.2 Uncharacterized protein CELE_F52G3.7 [Caenorhabditis elegans]
MDLRLCLFL